MVRQSWGFAADLKAQPEQSDFLIYRRRVIIMSKSSLAFEEENFVP